MRPVSSSPTTVISVKSRVTIPTFGQRRHSFDAESAVPRQKPSFSTERGRHHLCVSRVNVWS